jgi:predicted transcriptional regulator
MIGVKVDPEFKEILQNLASEDNRSLSNFIKHAIKTLGN